MNELWVISTLAFVAVLLGVEAIYSLITQRRQIDNSTNRRLAASAKLKKQTGASNALRSDHGIIGASIPLVRQLNDLIAQTGLHLNYARLLVGVVGLSAAFIVIFNFIFANVFIAFGLGALSALIVGVLCLRAVRQRRVARFAELLPDTIDVIVRAVRVGYPLPSALNLVANEMPDPVGPEFGMTADEISFGQDIRTAIENLHRRVGLDELMFLVVAINVQTQTGGNLAEILSRLSRLLRNRTKLHLKIRALSADGRISALVLSLMPFILLAGMTLIAPGYFGEVRNHPFVIPAMIYGVLSLIIGNFIMYRMVNFRF